jgi:hypothetical protein
MVSSTATSVASVMSLCSQIVKLLAPLGALAVQRADRCGPEESRSSPTPSVGRAANASQARQRERSVLWLSSPTPAPARQDRFVSRGGCGKTLAQLCLNCIEL